MAERLFLLLLAFLATSQAGSVDYATYIKTLGLPICRVELKLHDSGVVAGYPDGWNGNTIRMKTGPTTATFAVPLTPTSQLCRAVNDTSGSPTFGTLVDQEACSFTADIPSGWNVDFEFLWTCTTWPQENSAVLQLNAVQSYFGPVIYGESYFQPVTTPCAINVPVIAPVYNLICGPVPTAVCAITAARTRSSTAETLISWSPVLDSGLPLAFAVSVVDFSNPKAVPIDLGSFTSTSLRTILAPSTSYEIHVTAFNKYGPASSASLAYRTHAFDYGQLDVVMFAARADAWGPDGKLIFKVNGLLVGIGTVPPGATQSTARIIYPAGAKASTVTVHFVPPVVGVDACSFKISRNDNGQVLFDSGSSSTGPVYWDAALNVSSTPPPPSCGQCCLGAGQCTSADPTGYCCAATETCCRTGEGNVRPFTCCKGAEMCLTNYTGTQSLGLTCAVPAAICPDHEPLANSSCYGVLTCPYSSECCCPDDPVDRVCGPKVQYTCTGEPGSIWRKTNLNLPCNGDTSFSCPGTCPTQEPFIGSPCLGTRTCLFGKSCCCPDEPDAANQYCNYLRQWKCLGTVGGNWTLTSVVPGTCPDLCYSETKPGECPTVDPTPCPTTTNNTCNVDSECTETKKCCVSNCGRKCIAPCDCSVTPTCQSWERVTVIPGPGCCGGTKVCETDPDSAQCPTSYPSWDSIQCVPNNGTCGEGTKSRTEYIRDPKQGCLVSTKTQSCSIPCPVSCVGGFGPCGACTSHCKGGTCQRTYVIHVPASNGGIECPYTAGALSTPEACPNLPPCPLLCPLRVNAKDSRGDAWNYNTPWGFVTVHNNDTNELLTQLYLTRIGTTKTQLNFTAISVPSGTTLRIRYNKDRYPYEAMVQITSYFNNEEGALLYQDPWDSSLYGKSGTPGPKTTDEYLKITCTDCSHVDPLYCSTVEHRGACSMFNGKGPNGCGKCLPGWWEPVPGGECEDVDECAQVNNPCKLAGANCTNTVGGYQCRCPAGKRYSFGFCETPGICPDQRFRMEWFDLKPWERQKYVDAFKCLKDNDMWDAIWRIHGPTGGPGYPSIWHYGHDHGAGFWYFHRRYGLAVENAIRRCGQLINDTYLQCFSMPFWDSPSMLLADATPEGRLEKVRTEFFTSAKVDGYHIGVGERNDLCSQNHTFAWLNAPYCFNRGPDTDVPPTWESSTLHWDVVARATDLRGLSDLVGKHFEMHPWIGGLFGNMESSKDAVFWLHHGMYDYYWEVWKMCTNKNNWRTARMEDIWFAVSSREDYGADSPIYGYSEKPEDVYNNDAIKIYNPDANPPRVETISVVYSSTSLTRVLATGKYNCPAVVDRLFRRSIGDVTADEHTTGTSTNTNLIGKEFKGQVLMEESMTAMTPQILLEKAKKTRPPPHRWGAGNPRVHLETHTDFRETLRRMAGGSHTSAERQAGMLTHTWKASKSHLGRDAWLQLASSVRDEIPQDIGQQCRALTKSLIAQGENATYANLIGLECECVKTGGLDLQPLPSDFVYMMSIQQLCLQGACTPSCPAIYDALHGRESPKPSPQDETVITERPEDDDEETSAPEETAVPIDTPHLQPVESDPNPLISRLSKRVKKIIKK